MTASAPISNNEETAPPAGPRYASFILRCWQDSASLRARLVDVNSGVSYPIPNLRELLVMLGQILYRMSFRAPDDEVASPMNEEPVISEDHPGA